MAEGSSAAGLNKSPLLVVAGALVDASGRVLVQRRPVGKAHAGLWEFPGGKVETGETPGAALVRELAEELGINVSPESLSPVSFAETGNAGRPLILLLFRIDRWSGEPLPLDASALAWVNPRELAAIPMPPADYPLAAALARADATPA